MRLFLASQGLGDYADTLKQMVGENRQALVISNTRDYYNDEARITENVAQTLTSLERIGIKAERLDLRPYFGKQAELAQFIRKKQTGLIFAVGGNVICLATAIHASGLDEIIKQCLAKDEFVYGGYSAGSIVAGNDLSLYQFDTKPGERVLPHQITDITYDIYHLAPYKQGLGLISQYIVPHMDRTDHIDAMLKRLANIKAAGAEALLLNDSDVFVIDGEQTKIMRKEAL